MGDIVLTLYYSVKLGRAAAEVHPTQLTGLFDASTIAARYVLPNQL